jgi:uncharacterized membrane protein YfcA
MDVLFPTSGVEVFPLWPFLTALVVSFCTSMGGVSGAFLLLPYQVSVLGFTSPAVSSTNLVFNIVAIPSGVYRFIKEGRMLWPLALTMIVGLLPGVTLGAYIRLRVLPDPRVFKLFVGCVLLYIGGRLVWDIVKAFRAGQEKKKAVEDDGEANKRVKTTGVGLTRISYTYAGETHAFNPLWILLLVAAVGVIGGAYGIGGGALMAPILVTVFRLPVHSIAGATLSSTFMTSVIGVCVYVWIAPLFAEPGTSTSPDLLLGGLLGLGGLIGHYLGASLQKYVQARLIKVILAAVILIVSIRYVVQFFT